MHLRMEFGCKLNDVVFGHCVTLLLLTPSCMHACIWPELERSSAGCCLFELALSVTSSCSNMLANGRLSLTAVRLCCTAFVSAGRQHVHVKSTDTTRLGSLPKNTFAQQQQRQVKWRCHASKVKNMPDKQLQGTKEAANAGADDPAPNDHYDKILDKLEQDSHNRMDKAVSNTQEALARMTVRGVITVTWPADLVFALLMLADESCDGCGSAPTLPAKLIQILLGSPWSKICCMQDHRMMNTRAMSGS